MTKYILLVTLSSVLTLVLAGCQPTSDGAQSDPVVTNKVQAAVEQVVETTSDNFVWPRSYEYLSDDAVLVFSGTQSWRHDSGISGAKAFWSRESDAQGFGIFTSENPAIMSDENLVKFSTIIMNSTTGKDLLNASQKAALERFVENGGGLIIHHGGGDGSINEAWPWFTDLIGTKFISHPMAPQLQDARVVTLAPEHPVMEGLEDGFNHVDEWYTFSGPVSGVVTVLSGLDESTYSPVNTVYGDVSDLRMGPEPSDHPIIWAKCLSGDKGRVVYSALGHTVATFDNEPHQLLLKNALAWVRGETDPEGAHCPKG